jgi:hypothetical protein
MNQKSDIEPDFATLHTALKAHNVYTAASAKQKTQRPSGATASAAAESAERFLQRLEYFVLRNNSKNNNNVMITSDTSTDTSIIKEATLTITAQIKIIDMQT